jgi:voltage-gated potassium channel
MYIVEGPEHGFESIPRSIYWTIVTLTTVGYGDIVPHTAIGQILSMMVMVVGYGIIAVPTGIVSAEYVTQSKKAKEALKAYGGVCPTCNKEGHREDAEYCYNCGEKLKI